MKKLIALIAGMFFITFMYAEDNQRQFIYALASYSRDVKHSDFYQSVNIGASYEHGIVKGLKVEPELRMGCDWNDDSEANLKISLRALAGYRINAAAPITIYTGPTMETSIFRRWYGGDWVGGPVSKRNDRGKIFATWAFGLRLDFGRISIRGTYLLPLGNSYVWDEEKGLQSFEVGLGYRFKL